jgi:copper homeostasis protein
MRLEICANSYQSAINAQEAGADRIELCTELSIGGITPSYGLLKKVAKNIHIPVHVLIRPRSGNFVYTDNEFTLMKENIKLCKKLNVNGIVTGVLKSDNSIDLERTRELISLSKPLSFTFHRAFDCVTSPRESLLQLIDLKVDRLLTSGLKEKAENGIELLKELKQIAKDHLIILPSSGINSKNVQVFINAYFTEIHTSASKIIGHEKSVFFGNTPQTVSSIATMKKILKVINNA